MKTLQSCCRMWQKWCISFKSFKNGMTFCHDVLKRKKVVLNWNKDNGQNGSFTFFAPIFAPPLQEGWQL